MPSNNVLRAFDILAILISTALAIHLFIQGNVGLGVAYVAMAGFSVYCLRENVVSKLVIRFLRLMLVDGGKR